jgi:hypothetical protein
MGVIKKGHLSAARGFLHFSGQKYKQLLKKQEHEKEKI